MNPDVLTNQLKFATKYNVVNFETEALYKLRTRFVVKFPCALQKINIPWAKAIRYNFIITRGVAWGEKLELLLYLEKKKSVQNFSV